MAQAPLIPFDYLERQKRRIDAQREIDDPVAKAIGVMQVEQARSTIIRAPDPDTTAKVTRAARETGEPPALIEDRLGDIEKAQRAEKMGALLDLFPVYRLWAQEDPRGVVAASDDHKALGIIGSAWETVKKLPATAKAAGFGFMGSGAKMNAVFADYLGGFGDFLDSIAAPNTLTVGQMEERKAARKAYWNNGVSAQVTAAQQARPAYSGWLEQNVLQGIEQTPSSLVAVGAGALTRSPSMTMMLMGTQTGLPAVYEARQQGLDRVRAGTYGFTQGLIEVATEKIPATELLNAIAKKTPFGRALMVQLTAEIPQEQVATVLQDLSTWASLNPDKPFSAYLAERPEAALSTLVQTAVGTTVQTAVATSVSSTIEAGAKVAGRVMQAQQAKEVEPFFDQVERAAAESKLRQRDPQAYADLITRTANDAGVSQVFVPAEAIRAYQQSDSYDQFDDPFADYQAQIDEADAVGGDVVLPAGFALGTLPGTAAWNAVKADLRLAPGGMSAREAEALQTELDDVMAELSDQAAQRDRAQQGERTAREQIVQRVTAMLQNAGFTPANAAMQAELIAQREATRAARMGRNLTGNEFTTQVAQVLPPALGEIVQADNLDLVVNALRKGTGPQQIAPHPELPDLYHGGRKGMSIKDIKIIRESGQKQGKKGRVYGGFYATSKLDEAQGYADMTDGATIYRVQLRPDAKVEKKDGDVTRLSAQTISDYRSRGVDVVVGKDPRGRTEYVIINEAAIAGLQDTSKKQTAKNLPSTIQRGKSLLEWISARGGIEDRGGDIASMGGDKWHKGKVGKRKLLKPFDAAQGNILGGATSDNSVERLLDAAISEGYFPDLYAMRESGEKIDNNVLLEAIGQELAGSPLYAQEPVTDNVRAAADELAAMLAQRGLDASAMSDEEIRVAVSQMSQEGTSDVVYDQLPESIEIDGVTRPTRNSEGMPLAGSEEGLRAFWKWFGDSKVVDEEGRPLVVYHGTASDFGSFSKSADSKHIELPGFFFSPDAEIANRFSESASRKEFRDSDGYIAGYEGSNVLPVYLSIQDMADISLDDAVTGKMTSSKVVREALNDAKENGADGAVIRGWSDGSGETQYVAFSPTQIKSINNRGTFDPADARILYQEYGEGPRGRILFDNARPVRIELFQSRNLSTLLHELSHQWLEELRQDAENPDAPEQVKADWQAAQDWFAKNGHPVVDGVIPVEAHEMWARGGERYLMEGKAPSSALQRLFETFRGWLLSIYKTVEALRAPITPEIREVFDRLLATDEEIAAMAEQQALMPMFKDAAAIGMTGEEFNAYTAQAQAARDEANSTLLQKTMAAIRRRETKRFNDERNAVKADEAERLDNEPLLKSIRLMQATPIDLEWLVDRMGQDVVDLLPRRVPPLWRERGVNPDSLAELAGFGSGQQMIEVLIGAERQHRQAKEGGDQRTLRARMIDNAADAEMTRRYGDDPLNDGSIEQEAIAAVNGELQGELLASEVRLLARRTGSRPTPYKIARQWARNRVRTGLVSVEASPGAIQRHARNVAKAGRDAEKAMLAGKMDEALRFKQQQMLSSALLAEAKAAHDEVQDAVKRMGKIAKRATMKSVDQDYLEQAHALLEAVDLKPRTQKSIERFGKWAAWAEAREAEGYEVVVPPSFEGDISKTNWSRLSVETLLGLDEAVKQVMHLGRLKQTLLDKQEQREWDEIFQEAENAGGNIDGPPPKDMTEPGWWDAIKGGVGLADATLLKMETVFDWLDGGDPNGVFNRIAFRPIADAQAREQDMLKDYYGRIKALFEAVPAEVGARWQDKLELPFIDPLTGAPARMNRHKVIAMALNVGNEGNLQRLSDGYGWNPQAIEEYLNATLTQEEWQFVQGVWDTIDTLWPEIARIEREVNGVAPDKVEAREVQTPFGPLRGGYYPAVYDTTRDYKAEENRGRESDLFEGGYTRATTRASATKERSEKVSRQLLLDLGVINRHLGEVIHDITHREAVIRANRFLTNERVMRVVDQALGPDIRKQFRPWLKFVANSWAVERAGNEGFGKWIGKLRANATVVGMGLRATTMVTQIAGYSNSVEVVGEAAMAKALAQFYRNPAAAIRWVMEASDEVRNRMDTLDRDLRTELARLNAVTPTSKVMRQIIDAKKFMFHGIGYMDRLVSVPTWIAAYNNAIAAGMDEQDARYAGDKAVRQSQGAGGPKDLAAIQRGTGKWGEALKLFTMFYSYFSAQYQRQRTLARDVRGVDVRKSRSVPKLAARAFFLLVLPPLLTEVLRGAVGAPSGPDDEEWWAQWGLRKLLANALGPIPLARDVFEPTWNAAVGNKFFNPSVSPIQRAYDTVVKVGRDAGKLAAGDETKTATKDVLELAGYTTGLVPGQVASATQFLVDVGSGDADPQGFSDWIEGLSTGKIKED